MSGETPITSGRDVLRRIDASIAQARSGVGDINASAASRAARLAAVERAEADAYRSIAAIRIDHLQSEDLAKTLGAADEDADELIAAHEAHLEALSRDLDAASAAIERLEAERQAQEETLNAAVSAHDEAVAKTNARLDADPDYQSRAEALEAANAIAERAAAKLDVARADRNEKGAPYEADPLFSYLWARKFGTKDYAAFPLFAALDRWVAGLARYRDARLNYARLLELPDRFAEHLERVRADADAIAADLEAYERAALEADGVGPLRDAARNARAALADIDEKLDAAEIRHRDIAAAHAEAAAGRAGPLDEARARIAAVLADRSIPDLKALAAQTLTLEDDRIVEDLIRLRRERMEIEEETKALRNAIDKQSTILGNLESLRRRYKTARYDSPYSEFPDETVVGVVLSELLRGALREADAWRRLSRAQRRRQRDWSDDFGGAEWREGFGLPQDWGDGGWSSGGFGGGRTRPARTPRAPRAPRRPRAPRAPRGGGFRTGGGF